MNLTLQRCLWGSLGVINRGGVSAVSGGYSLQGGLLGEVLGWVNS